MTQGRVALYTVTQVVPLVERSETFAGQAPETLEMDDLTTPTLVLLVEAGHQRHAALEAVLRFHPDEPVGFACIEHIASASAALSAELTLEFGDRLEMTCVYDTSGDAQPTIPGWGTQNEMCFMGLYLSEG